MNRLEQRLERLESSARADNARPQIIIIFGKEVGRCYRLGAGGGLVEVDEDGNDIAPGVSHEPT